jgi:hypothetical protein
MEFKVDVDRVVGTVPFVEADEDLSVRKLALDRRRNSLKKGIASTSDKTKERANQATGAAACMSSNTRQERMLQSK